jgi:hypothetical protein
VYHSTAPKFLMIVTDPRQNLDTFPGFIFSFLDEIGMVGCICLEKDEGDHGPNERTSAVLKCAGEAWIGRQ